MTDRLSWICSFDLSDALVETCVIVDWNVPSDGPCGSFFPLPCDLFALATLMPTMGLLGFLGFSKTIHLNSPANPVCAGLLLTGSPPPASLLA